MIEKYNIGVYKPCCRMNHPMDVSSQIAFINHRLNHMEREINRLKHKLGHKKQTVKISRSLPGKSAKSIKSKKMTDEEIAKLVEWERESVGSKVDRESVGGKL